MALDREELRQIIRRRLAGQKVVAAETDDEGAEQPPAQDEFDARSASLEALRSKLADRIGHTPDARPLRKASQFVIVGPEGEEELAADRTAPRRRVTVVSSETRDVIAKQG